jgi:Cellulase (glycosyl hydrolase family 5)
VRPTLTRRELVRGGAGGAAAAVAYLIIRGTSSGTSSPPLEPLGVDAAGTGFAGVSSSRPFSAWGFNWGGPGAYRDLDAVRDGFSQMRSLGANTVRIHLQFGDLMESPSRARPAELDHIAAIVRIAEEERVYLDISGNEVWLPAFAPPWYDGLSESARWDAQAAYWSAVAQTCADSPAVFCYDLLSEPLVAGGLPPGHWYTGKFGGFYFGQYISLQLDGRQPAEVARAWLERLTAAVRAHDSRHLITLGLLPRPAASGFDPARIAPLLDFLSLHVYPKTGQAPEAIAAVQDLAAHGKPVLIEETYILEGDVPTLERFILGTRLSAAGWLGFYDDRLPMQVAHPRNFNDALQQQWLGLFRKYAPTLARTPSE